MTIHRLHLNAEPFDLIKLGKKKIEYRLYDEKRQKINIGDTLIFINRKNDTELITVTVDSLHHAKSFHELFMNDNLNDKAAEKLSKFYTKDQQNKYGVVGIAFTLKPLQ